MSTLTPTALARLISAAVTLETLMVAYDNVLSDLFARPPWERGTVDHRRVLWSQAKRARTEDNATFKSPGIYIWGVDDRPLYIGKATKSFGKRFSRYIWHPKSQCNLACQFENSLIASGLDGFPTHIHEWYASFARSNSKVRLEGAVVFAKEGIGSVWFALLPHDNPSEISQIEKVLIPIAQSWNKHRKLRPLLNRQYIVSEGPSTLSA
jgi:hypothetical protein